MRGFTLHPIARVANYILVVSIYVGAASYFVTRHEHKKLVASAVDKTISNLFERLSVSRCMA